ncbi:mutM, fpg [Phaffia rhodozyma]|uniref:MutM, fpg n=1 Tax=Phaffia rhodozyma TaxID=264483 RepID=A0A0F7SW64_PHARH|nr:mutM, fpg [Phaffia rhodozyma]
MPELPEVERARSDLERAAKGRRIDHVEWAPEDNIVFVNVEDGEFDSTLQGRTVLDVKRKGKVFWMVLSKEGKLPVLHFGMTGALRIKGEESLKYVEGPKSVDDWPPKYMKFILTLGTLETDEEGSAPVQIAFIDPRRLARIKLLQDPENEPPISLLGPDPVLSPPTDEEFKALIGKRAAPIKSVLLDQSVAAGVGNWVADEILYQARIHPLQQAKSLSDDELARIRLKMCDICRFAVQCRSESSIFPSDWLFLNRWGKGKSKKLKSKADDSEEENQSKGPRVVLEDGTRAPIEFLTIGGRTAAFVPTLQILPPNSPGPKKAKAASKSKPITLDVKFNDSEVNKPPKRSKAKDSKSGFDDETESKPQPKSKKAKTEPASPDQPIRTSRHFSTRSTNPQVPIASKREYSSSPLSSPPSKTMASIPKSVGTKRTRQLAESKARAVRAKVL